MPLPVPAKTRRRLVFLFSLPLVFSLVFFGVNLLSERTDIHLIDIQNLERSITELRRLAKDVESNERGFLLTGDSRYLLHLNEAAALLPLRIKICQSYAANRPELKHGINTLANFVQQRFELAKELLEAQREKNFAAALEVEKTGKPDDVMDKVEMATADVLKDVRGIEEANLEREGNLTRWTFIFFSVDPS